MYENIVLLQPGGGAVLLDNFDDIAKYEKVFVSKVFTDTKIPDWVVDMPNVECGGTGFFYDKALPLPKEIEHSMPDYHLYDNYVESKIKGGESAKNFRWYTDYSIGFMTRGCFRHCEFCVNKNYNMSSRHSNLSEFYDPSRKKICLLDDNFLACSEWKSMLLELRELNKPFVFRQGLDERLLTKEKCELLFSSKYDGDFIFAFDNINDYDLIEEKLKIIREYTYKNIKFYLLVGFDRNGRYDGSFWKTDIIDMFKRIELLMRYNCVPYIMRFERYVDSPYKGTYITTARWCNQPSFFKRKSYEEFVEADAEYLKKDDCSTKRYYNKLVHDIPDAKQFLSMKWK